MKIKCEFLTFYELYSFKFYTNVREISTIVNAVIVIIIINLLIASYSLNECYGSPLVSHFDKNSIAPTKNR